MRLIHITASTSYVSIENGTMLYNGQIDGDHIPDRLTQNLQAEIDEMNAGGIVTRQYERAANGDFRHDTLSDGTVVEDRALSAEVWSSDFDDDCAAYIASYDAKNLADENALKAQEQQG